MSKINASQWVSNQCKRAIRRSSGSQNKLIVDLFLLAENIRKFLVSKELADFELNIFALVFYRIVSKLA